MPEIPTPPKTQLDEFAKLDAKIQWNLTFAVLVLGVLVATEVVFRVWK